jgi:hypothetical protein
MGAVLDIAVFLKRYPSDGMSGYPRSNINQKPPQSLTAVMA